MYAIHHRQHENGTWYWSVHFVRAGKSYNRRFYEPKFGGSPNAKKAAVAWRDDQLAKAKPLTMMEFCQRPRCNNTSGMTGVHFLRPARQPEGIWQAKLKIGGGKCQSLSFSVLAHSHDAGNAMAMAARQEMLAGVNDRPYLYDAVARRLAPAGGV